jgi:hypothetical protein
MQIKFEKDLDNLKNLQLKNCKKFNLNTYTIDNIRHNMGYISSSNLLKLWIDRFGIETLFSDLNWIYRDDLN